MFGLPSIRLGRPFGIPLEVDASWFFIFLLVASTLTFSYFPSAIPDQTTPLYVFLGVVTALAFFGSLVLHELAHSLVARAGGIKIAKVTLFVFGGVSQMEEEPASPGRELMLAVAGPATSVAIGALSLLVRGGLVGAGAPSAAWVPFEYLGFINLSLAAFNMLPGFPLDGGRVLRAFLWATTKDVLKATRWASRSGQAIGLLFMATAVIGVIRGSFDFIWLMVMGWFLSNMSASAYQQQLMRAALAKVTLRQVMTAPAVLAPAGTSLEEMTHSYFLGGRHTKYPVVDNGHVIGLIDLASLKEVPRERWGTTTAADVATRDLAEVVASPDASLDSVLARLEPNGPGAVLVVENGRLAGIVTRSDVIQFIRESSRPS